jgi:hypothetical protein
LAQEDLHDTISFQVRERFEFSELLSKLISYGDIRKESEDCFRFYPKNPDWPETCFYEDGKLYVITENHFMDEIEEFVTMLSEILGVEIVGE